MHDSGAGSVYDTLLERGYIAQVSDEDGVRELLAGTGVRFYIGFDPTADSLHVGHFIPMMVMAHLQRAGHVPIALMGCGTAMVGDPSGRTDLRQMMTLETISANAERFREQMRILLDFSDDRALMVNNADWLLGLNYVDFLRDIGVHFSVNRMLAAEAYKQRMEKGLTFLEFNYMLMQAYDFLELHRRYGVRLQLGGDDQWSNILAGADLIRRKEQTEAYALTIKLLTTSEGIKMGKTARGALWLDPEKCPVFDFYQYWRNIDDADVLNSMRLVTFVPMEEIRGWEHLTGSQLNPVKERLAWEVTAIVHGREAADAARQQARALFAGPGEADDMPETLLDAAELEAGVGLLELLERSGLSPSRSAARRLVRQGGVRLDDEVISDESLVLTAADFADGHRILRAGKKRFHRLRPAD
ncbi:MAG: tyrosine--tRNA ligase [Bacillota bacterium]|nr:tyrosine--tRNA ligase [Bacillota bacterium]